MDTVKVPLSRFAESIKGTHDEVFVGVLRVFHKREKHTPSEWRALIDSHRARPVKLER